MKKISAFSLTGWALLALCSSWTVHAESPANITLVTIQDAWARPSNPGSTVGAAYMTLTSSKDASLVEAKADVSDSVEIHSMSMENGVMKMRMLESLDLSAGKPYKLSPGGFHLMLFDLKKPLRVGDSVNFVLTFKLANKSLVKQTVKASVKDAPAASH
jgi:copper(I)-binding protein